MTPTPPEHASVIKVIDSRKGCLYYTFLMIVLCIVSFAACAVLPFLAPAPDEVAPPEESHSTAPAQPERAWIKREGIR